MKNKLLIALSVVILFGAATTVVYSTSGSGNSGVPTKESESVRICPNTGLPCDGDGLCGGTGKPCDGESKGCCSNEEKSTCSSESICTSESNCTSERSEKPNCGAGCAECPGKAPGTCPGQ